MIDDRNPSPRVLPLPPRSSCPWLRLLKRQFHRKRAENFTSIFGKQSEDMYIDNMDEDLGGKLHESFRHLYSFYLNCI